MSIPLTLLRVSPAELIKILSKKAVFASFINLTKQETGNQGTLMRWFTPPLPLHISFMYALTTVYTVYLKHSRSFLGLGFLFESPDGSLLVVIPCLSALALFVFRVEEVVLLQTHRKQIILGSCILHQC